MKSYAAWFSARWAGDVAWRLLDRILLAGTCVKSGEDEPVP
jgi:hypothetical protein